MKRKLLVVLIPFGIAFILFGLFTEYITSTEQVWSVSSFGDSSTLSSMSDRITEMNVTNSGSIIQVLVQSNCTLVVELAHDGRLELRWTDVELKRNVQIRDIGAWSVRFLNNNTEDNYCTYNAMIQLKTPHLETRVQYPWLQLPLIVLGSLTLIITIFAISFSFNSVRQRITARVVKTLAVVIILVLIIFSYQIGGLILSTPHPWMVCQGTSMEPTIHYGDLVLIKGINPQDLVPDDIIVFEDVNLSPDSTEISRLSVPVAHRILYITANDVTLYFKTKGDNNPTPDDWIVPSQGVLGKSVWIIPSIGTLLLILQNIQVKIAIISILVIAFFLWPAINKSRKQTSSSTKLQSTNPEVHEVER